MLSDARLYVISADAPPKEQVAILCAAIDGGADIVQLRNKTSAPAELVDPARDLCGYGRSRGVPVIVNDYLEVAIESDADGLHLGQDGMTVEVARWLLTGDKLLGRSTHSLQQVTAAAGDGAHYIGVGPVFATPTKPGRPPTGLGLLTEVASAVKLPWFAIGGIDAANIDDVIAAGARRVAVVRAVCSAADPAAAAAALKARLTAPTPVTSG